MERINLNVLANGASTIESYKYLMVRDDIKKANFILEYLTENGRSRCSDISNESEYCCQNISAMLKKLVKLGIVKREEVIEGTTNLENVWIRKKIVVDGLTYYSEPTYGNITVPNKVAYFSLV